MPAPRQLGPYRLLRRLGAGGMGEVWLAEHAALGVQRALKLLPALRDAEDLLRFEREAEAMARLDHPHVARIHERGEHQGQPYLVLDLLPGGDLEARLRQGPLALEEATALIEQLASGLDHMHAQGILHRDIKPANVLFDDQQRPVWVDFGLARLEGAEALTRTGTILGTPASMAPEQALGQRDQLGPRTDVYGLGVLLYQLLTGTPPFRAGSLTALLAQVLEVAPDPPSRHRPGLPAAVDRVVLQALAKRPGERPATPGALARALREAATGRSPRGRARPLAAALVLILAAAFAVAWGQRRPTAAPVAAAPPPPTSVSVPAPPPQTPPELPTQVGTQVSLELPGHGESLVAYTADGALRVATSAGWLLEADPRTGDTRQLLQFAPGRVWSFWQGPGQALLGAGDVGLRVTDAGVRPVALDGVRCVGVDPSGRWALLGLATSCWRLDLQDPEAEAKPFVAGPEPGEQLLQPRAILWLSPDAFLVSWGIHQEWGSGDEPAPRLAVYDRDGTPLALERALLRLSAFAQITPEIWMGGDSAGVLFTLHWTNGELRIERWSEGEPLPAESSFDEVHRVLSIHLPTCVRGIVAAGPPDARYVYAVSEGGTSTDGHEERLVAWRWPSGERVGLRQLHARPIGLALAPRADWLAIGTKDERVLLYRLEDGAPAWESAR